MVRDLLIGMDRVFPDRAEFRHGEGNSAAHLKASIIGSSVTVIVDKGRLVLGTWQGIYFAEIYASVLQRCAIFHNILIGACLRHLSVA